MTDLSIEEIQDIKHHKYLIMVSILVISTILYCVPFALSLIDIATNNKFGKYTLFIISGIYLFMNIINILVYIKVIYGYNKTIRVLESGEIKRNVVKRAPDNTGVNDHVVINMPGSITGDCK